MIDYLERLGDAGYDDALPEEVNYSLSDIRRICPILAGVGWIKGNQLRLRLPAGELVVDAPARMLCRALEWCDGTTPWVDVVAKAPSRERSEFSEFLEFLYAQGAIVDGIHLTRIAVGFGAQTTSIGTEASSRVTDQLALRFKANLNTEAPGRAAPAAHDVGVHPLDGMLSDRTSAHTFSGKSVSKEQLMAMLWSAAGAVRDVHPRGGNRAPQRTVASAGAMYLVKWTLILKLPVDGYQPGVYEVSYPGPRQVALKLCHRDTSLLYRAFLMPWHLTFAVGVLVAHARVDVAALRYRNRALQYLFIEAGSSLQNMALCAPALGLGHIVMGGYCEDTLRQICRVENETLLCSAIFGANATEVQVEQLSGMPAIDFVWSDAPTGMYDVPFYIARSRVKGQEDVRYNTWGKDRDPELAYIKAHAETVERQGLREPKNISMGLFGDLANAINPSTLCAYTKAQYSNTRFPYSPFDPDSVYNWVAGVNALTGGTVHVPADYVYPVSLLPTIPGKRKPCAQASSSGCAAGTTPEMARINALLEVIERDAFMRHWMQHRPGYAIDITQLPAVLRARVLNLQGAECKVYLQVLESVAATVCLAAVTHESKHFTCVAASARFDFEQAVTGALDEVETMVYTRMLGQHFDPLRPTDVSDPEGHSLLYAQKRYFHLADAVLHPVQGLEKIPVWKGAHDLDRLVGDLASLGLSPSFIDLTPKKNCIDQGRKPLSVVKAVVPSLIPISFGHGREPRAMIANCDRRSFFPHPFP